MLVVEDELDIAALIRHTLERGGDMAVEIVSTGDAALKATVEQSPDLIVLDLNLPVLGGLEVCRLLRQRSARARVPIIMLTARTSESDRVVGLDAGADDYVTKPFSLRELAARVRAVLRRGRPEAPATASVYRGQHLTADFDAVSVVVEGHSVRLTRREFEHCATSSRTRIACSLEIDCSSGSGDTTAQSRRVPSTCISGGCGASSVLRDVRSKQLWGSAIDSWSNFGRVRAKRSPSRSSIEQLERSGRAWRLLGLR